MFALDAPLWLLLLLLVPALWFFRARTRGRGGSVPVAWKSWKGEGFIAPPGLQRLVFPMSELLPWVILVLLVFSMAQPVLLGRTKTYLNDGKEIIFLLDLSPSMAAQDSPGQSRLSMVKSMVHDFIGRRQNDSIGLVAFASDAALYVPPTLDYRALGRSLDRLEVMDLGDGTSLGLGLSVAALHFDRMAARERVLVLVSDGDTNSGEIDVRSGMDLLRALGVVVHVIGVGSNREVDIEFEDPQTGRIFRGTYQSMVDEPALRRLADQGKGRYFSGVSVDSLSAAVASLDNLELSDTKIRYDIQRTSLVGGILMVVMLLFMLEQMLKRWYLREVS